MERMPGILNRIIFSYQRSKNLAPSRKSPSRAKAGIDWLFLSSIDTYEPQPSFRQRTSNFGSAFTFTRELDVENGSRLVKYQLWAQKT